MFRSLLTSFCISLSLCVFAQDPAKESLAPCGTPGGMSPWLKQYKANLASIPSDRSEDTLWVAIQIHLLAKDNGAGRFANDKVLDAFCRLNTDFGPTGIQFYMKDDFNLINSTAYHTHSTIEKGIEMMLTNNVPDALNCYFVADPAGNCGYNLPYAGVAISHGCGGPNDHTWAHEVGHALSLPHPFIGWEGKVYNYSVPTPTLLTYDYTHFHDSLETTIPAPLDTALVEYVDGSNCTIAADLFCDTKPDYLSYRWNCNTVTNMSTTLQKDPNGADFYSDGTLFMSYANDACQNRFSPDEIAAMRANLMTEKAAWVTPTMLENPVTELAVAVEPVQDAPAPSTGAKLVWKPVPNATHYLVQASRLSTYALREVDIVTTDTSAIAGALALNKTYYWRVRAFNKWHPCAPFTASSTFLTTPVTSAYEPDWEGWRCYPSLLTAGQALSMDIPEKWRGAEAVARIFDMAGKMVFESHLSLYSPKMTVDLPSISWSKGMYRLVLTSTFGVKNQALFIGG
jgi:hypothetical protein